MYTTHQVAAELSGRFDIIGEALMPVQLADGQTPPRGTNAFNWTFSLVRRGGSFTNQDFLGLSPIVATTTMVFYSVYVKAEYV